MPEEYDKLETERQVFLLVTADMLQHLTYMRSQGGTSLHPDILKEYGCRTTQDFAGKLRSVAAAANVKLPAFVDDFLK